MAEKPKLYPGPYAIEFVFSTVISTVALEHKLELNCKVIGDPVPGTALGSILVQKAGGGTQTATLCITDFWTQYRIGHGTGTTALSAILWKYTPMSYEKLFIAAYGVALGAGTGVGAPNPGHQTQITLRSALGSYMRVNWVEDPRTERTQQSLAPLITGDAQQRVASYLLSVNGWASARDGSFPVAAMKTSFTENEAISRKRFRPNV